MNNNQQHPEEEHQEFSLPGSTHRPSSLFYNLPSSASSYSQAPSTIHPTSTMYKSSQQSKKPSTRQVNKSSPLVMSRSLVAILILLSALPYLNASVPNGNSDYEDDSTTPLTRRTDFVVPQELKGKCILKDVCETKSNLVGDVNVPCVESHDPHKVDSESLVTLRSICPDLFTSDADPFICCDSDQIYELEQSFAIPRQLGLDRCPSCSVNWRANFCQLTCSPTQSDFIKVNKSSKLPDGRFRLDAADYHLTESYANGLYDSCKGVEGLVGGQKLLDLMCGQWGSKLCSAQKWLEFLGLSIENQGQSPFQINYLIHPESNEVRRHDKSPPAEDNGILPMDINTFRCSQAPSSKENPCSCTDCQETCEIRVLPEAAKYLPESKPPVNIIGMSGALFSSIFLFILLVILIVGYFMGMKFHHKRSQTRKWYLISWYNTTWFHYQKFTVLSWTWSHL